MCVCIASRYLARYIEVGAMAGITQKSCVACFISIVVLQKKFLFLFFWGGDVEQRRMNRNTQKIQGYS